MERRELVWRHFSLRFTYLDVGCGDLYVWRGFPPPNVTLLDVDLYKYLHVNADANHLPFRDKAFDYVLLLEVLEHVEDVVKVLEEAMRVARVAVIVSYPDEDVEQCVRKRDYSHYLDFIQSRGAVINDAMPQVDVGGGRVFIHHFHWKSRKRVEEDVKKISELCGEPILLHDVHYRGWGWVCRL